MDSASFMNAVDLYQQNLVNYKMTGKQTYKIAAENAQKWIDSYLRELRGTISQNQQYAEGFIREYANSNPELMKIQQELRDIREKAPKVQDTYETVKQLNEAPEEDDTSLYVKIGATVLLVGVATMVSLMV
jgi:hypothetical protein